MLKLKVTNQEIILEQVTPYGDPLVANSKGEYECIFEFDESWNGFVKSAVFNILPDECPTSCQKKIRQPEPVILEDDRCLIPAQALRKGTRLQIGVYGVKEDIQRPTVFTSPLLVRTGALPVVPEDDVETPRLYIQMLEIMQKTQEIAQSVRDDADAGKFNGKGVPQGGLTNQALFKKSDASFDTEWRYIPIDTWEQVTGKPFDELDLDEFEIVVGEVEGTKVLGIKAIDIAKVTGLQEALDSKIAEVKVNGVALAPSQGSVDVAVPTKVSQVENDAGYLTEATIPTEYVTETELQPKLDEKLDLAGGKMTGVLDMGSQIVKNVAPATAEGDAVNLKQMTDELAKKLNLSGGKMSGAIDMGNFALDNVPKATKDTQAINYKQLKEAIAGLGNIFDLKGSKPTFDALPKDGNKIGDVWYVKDEEVGYIWLDDDGVQRWEKFGPTIDLSGYLQIKNLAGTTGSGTETAMTQKAVTDELNKKQDKGDYATRTELSEGLATKQPTGDYAVKGDIDAVNQAIGDVKASDAQKVAFIEQILQPEQKVQARKNIEASAYTIIREW